jgi:acyl-CoA synthetase (AMP-forming)/AMP-acid ligase II
MRGYYKAEPIFPGDEHGFLRTGDAGYLRSDGLLVFTGRIDRLIKTAGVNVSPVEIEEHLQEWGRLGACGVTGVPHPTKGFAVVVCAVPAARIAISQQDVIGFLRTRVAAYKVPQAVVFLTNEELPVTSGGKVVPSALPELAIEKLLAGEIESAWRQHLLSRHEQRRNG